MALKSNACCGDPACGCAALNPLTCKLTPSLAKTVADVLKNWDAEAKVARLWALDSSLWLGRKNPDAGDLERLWLGWLSIADQQFNSVGLFEELIAEATSGQFDDALLIGMGGSSLGPEVLAMTFGRAPGFPQLHVLDSTDPAQVRAFEAKINLKRTLFIVASKSGSTLEPNILKAHFLARAKAVVGERKARERFLIITDPGSDMEKAARAEGIPQAHIFYGLPNIGGRFSVLSNFGIVPAAVMGLDLAKFLGHAKAMAQACSPGAPAAENPGVVLGAVLGVAHNQGRNKLTLVASPGLFDLGAWLEQLIAESTGKDGKAIIPVDREALGEPALYGEDRLFVYLRLASAPDGALDKAVAKLERAGQPVVRIDVCEPYCLAEEFFRWEIATAVAGSILGINPFNQPDVVFSKKNTSKLMEEFDAAGSLPAEAPFASDGDIRLFANPRNAAELKAAAGPSASLADYLKAHLARLGTGDYFALLAYVEMNSASENIVQAMRHAVRDRKKVATCLGFGPRFLHSTGQAYKGGPNTGVFLQITGDDADDLRVPGEGYTFGIVKAAQARGDFNVLAARRRRALRVHLGADVKAGLARLAAAMAQALA